MKPASIIVRFDRRKTASKTTKGAVEIELYHRGSRVRIATGIRLYSNEWRNGRVVNNIRAGEYNTMIHDRLAKVEDMLLKGVSIENIRLLLKEEGGFASPIAWMNASITNSLRAKRSKDMCFRIVRKVEALHRLHNWCDVNTQLIEAFDGSMLRAKISRQSIYIYHSNFRTILQRACEAGLIEVNPYTKFKFKPGKQTEVCYLTEDERTAFENVEPILPSDSYSKDLFLLACYTGLSYADIIKIKRSDIKEANGELYIDDKRTKTQVPYHIKLLPQAVAILEHLNYLDCPRFCTATVFARIRALAFRAGIYDKDVSMHVGRHTFATWALSKGMRIEYVSAILGHTNIKMTQRYAKVLKADLDNAFDLLK